MTQNSLISLFCGAILLSLGCTSAPTESRSTLKNATPLILAHRGYPGKLPDHTLESYLLAIESGADVIEPDLVMTKDGVLICRHENELSLTTNVEVVFPKRKTTKVIDGEKVTGWFSEDFTLTEIKTLRARQPLPFRDQKENDKFQIPTFDEFLSLIKKESEKRQLSIGIYPEIKHSTYFRNISLPMEDHLLATLKERGFDKSTNPVYIQSFEIGNLQSLSKHKDYVTKYKLIQLIGSPHEVPFDQTQLPEKERRFRNYKDLLTTEGLQKTKSYLHGLGIWKGLLYLDSGIVDRAHKAGLKVHAYTFRDEPQYIDSKFSKDSQSEYIDFFRRGVDGVFSDHTSIAIRARNVFLNKNQE